MKQFQVCLGWLNINTHQILFDQTYNQKMNFKTTIVLLLLSIIFYFAQGNFWIVTLTFVTLIIFFLANPINEEFRVVYIKANEQNNDQVYQSLARTVKDLGGIHIQRWDQTSESLPNALIKIPVANAQKLLSETYIENVESLKSYLNHASKWYYFVTFFQLFIFH